MSSISQILSPTSLSNGSLAARRRTLRNYEGEGRYFYSVAAREPEPPWQATLFEALANL